MTPRSFNSSSGASSKQKWRFRPKKYGLQWLKSYIRPELYCTPHKCCKPIANLISLKTGHPIFLVSLLLNLQSKAVPYRNQAEWLGSWLNISSRNSMKAVQACQMARKWLNKQPVAWMAWKLVNDLQKHTSKVHKPNPTNARVNHFDTAINTDIG